LSNESPNKLSINGLVSKGVLHFTWSYDGHRYDRSTIANIADDYKSILLDIIDLCSGIEDRVLTPSDYGLSGLVSYADLRDFLAQDRGYDIVSLYRLSPLQEGLLFHSLYDNASNAYVVQMSFDIIGDFNISYFKESWECVVSKHSILRTGFDSDSLDVGVQYVYDSIDLPFWVLDYKDKSLEELSSFLDKDAHTTFDLKSGPLFRLQLLELSGGVSKFVFTNHHLLLDGWSTPILLGEVIRTYQELLDGDSISIVGSKDNYGDYIKRILGKDRHASLSYWRDHLSGLESPSYLPFVVSGKERNKVFGNVSDRLQKGSFFMQSLSSFSHSHQVTINTIIQGVWSYLLSCYTGNDTVVFGTVISGRDGAFEGIESRVGLYINTIPLCVRVDRGFVIADWLSSIQSSYTRSREDYGYSSLSDLQKVSNIEGELFDTLMVFENYPLDAVQGLESDLVINNFQGKEQTNYTLSLTVQSSPEELSIDFGYHNGVLSSDTVSMIRSHFEEVLDSLLLSSEIGDLRYLSDEESHRLLVEFNNTDVSYPEDVTVLDLFRDQVVANPDGIAVVYEEEELTYRELDERSNQLAHYLLGLGVEKYGS